MTDETRSNIATAQQRAAMRRKLSPSERAGFDRLRPTFAVRARERSFVARIADAIADGRCREGPRVVLRWDNGRVSLAEHDPSQTAFSYPHTLEWAEKNARLLMPGDKLKYELPDDDCVPDDIAVAAGGALGALHRPQRAVERDGAIGRFWRHARKMSQYGSPATSLFRQEFPGTDLDIHGVPPPPEPYDDERTLRGGRGRKPPLSPYLTDRVGDVLRDEQRRRHARAHALALSHSTRRT